MKNTEAKTIIYAKGWAPGDWYASQCRQAAFIGPLLSELRKPIR